MISYQECKLVLCQLGSIIILRVKMSNLVLPRSRKSIPLLLSVSFAILTTSSCCFDVSLTSKYGGVFRDPNRPRYIAPLDKDSEAITGCHTAALPQPLADDPRIP